MKLVKVTYDFFKMCKDAGADPNEQLLHDHAGRPCVLLLKLKYKGKKLDFVVPIKSNITPTVDKTTYLALPPNPRTKKGNFHGVFYIKLFPVTKKYIKPYLYESNKYLCTVKGIIDSKEKEIIAACQDYLDNYAKGKRNAYTPEIDAIISLIIS